MPQTIHVAHSPDSDDAFMFYALAEGKIDTGNLRYEHRAVGHRVAEPAGARRKKELDVSAVSIHAYAYLADDYALLSSGSSMGDGYGPRLVSKHREACGRPAPPRRGSGSPYPGLLTTAYLALSLWQPDFEPVVTPLFDKIEGAVQRRGSRPRPADSRRPAHVRRRWLQAVGRHGRMVARRNRPAASARRQRGPPRSQARCDRTDRPRPARQHRLRTRPPPPGARSCPPVQAAASPTSAPTRSSACM